MDRLAWWLPVRAHLLRGLVCGAVLGASLAVVETVVLAGYRRALRSAEWDVVLIAVVVEALALAVVGGLLGLLLGVVGRLIVWRSGHHASLRRVQRAGAQPWGARSRPDGAHVTALYAAGTALLFPVAVAFLRHQTGLARGEVIGPFREALIPAVGTGLGIGLAVFALTLLSAGRGLVAWGGRLALVGALMLSVASVPARPVVGKAVASLAGQTGARPYAAPGGYSAGYPLAAGPATAVPSGYPASSLLAAATATAPTVVPASSSDDWWEEPRVLPGAGRPNVLFITVDTLRADHLGAYGYNRGKTPNMDALARRGVRFERAIVSQPNTNAAHASLFTGTDPHTHGLRAHMVDRVRGDLATLPAILRDSGYATGGIYSWVSLEPAFSGLNRGFQSYQGYVVNKPQTLQDGRLQYLAATYRRLSEYLQVVRTSELVLRMGNGVEEQIDGKADVTTEAVLQWLEKQPAEPFFLWAHYFDPHYPWTPPPPYDTLFDPDFPDKSVGGWETVHKINAEIPLTEREIEHVVAKYDGEIAFVDEQLGRVFHRLEEKGILDNTIVVLTGDHGESFAERGHWLHPGSLYDSEVRVPLLIAYPGKLPAGQVVAAPVTNADVMPTLLQLLGLPIPPTVEGRTLLPLVDGRETGDDRIVFTALPDDATLALVMREWKLIMYLAEGDRIELFNLPSDPEELTDVAEQYPEVAARLLEKLNRWMDGFGKSTEQVALVDQP